MSKIPLKPTDQQHEYGDYMYDQGSDKTLNGNSGMSDIEQRLREAHPISQQYANGSKIFLEAADEIATLREQLEAKDSDYRAARESEKILMDRLDDFRGQLEASQAQCAELSDALLTLRKPWDLGQILGAETRRRVEKADKALSGRHGEAFVLIKQAEAVESLVDRLNHEDPIRSLMNEAEQLRNQAKKLEEQQ